jgi:hypothetical protein
VKPVFFEHVAEVRDSPNSLRIEMKNYSHYHKNGNVLNQSSMDIDFVQYKLIRRNIDNDSLNKDKKFW